MSVTISPLEDRVAIQSVEKEQTTSSGLVIPDNAQEKPHQGKVVAVGPGRVADSGERIAMDVAVGDTVFYSRYGGEELKVGEETFLILPARDILAKLN